MKCQFCKEIILEGAIKCRHCGSMLNESQQSQPSSSYSTGYNNNSQQHMVFIDSLKINESYKKVFHLIDENKIEKFSTGIPVFITEDKRLKPFSKIFDKESIFSLWAMAFGPFYYLATGLWKKGIILLIIIIGAGMIFEKIFGASGNAIGYGFSLWIGMIAKYDRYRKLVLKEDFWW